MQALTIASAEVPRQSALIKGVLQSRRLSQGGRIAVFEAMGRGLAP
jgi:hypothetical protein